QAQKLEMRAPSIIVANPRAEEVAAIATEGDLILGYDDFPTIVQGTFAQLESAGNTTVTAAYFSLAKFGKVVVHGTEFNLHSIQPALLQSLPNAEIFVNGLTRISFELEGTADFKTL